MLGLDQDMGDLNHRHEVQLAIRSCFERAGEAGNSLDHLRREAPKGEEVGTRMGRRLPEGIGAAGDEREVPADVQQPGAGGVVTLPGLGKATSQPGRFQSMVIQEL